jgi:hypothetical protein
MNKGLKMNSSQDMYRWYIAKMLKENPDFYTEYDNLIRKKGIVVLMKKVNGKKEVHMSYTWFKSIVERNNSKAKLAVINGKRYNLGHGLGYLQARRVERNFSKPKINVIETVRYRKTNPDKSKNVIYYTDQDYCRIAWHKIGGARNESVYEFKPAKEFRLSFSKAQFEWPNLKFKYLFFPLLSVSA